MNRVKGDLFEFIKTGDYAATAQGCNCFCVQGAGVAKRFAAEYQTNEPSIYALETVQSQGSLNKLGAIESRLRPIPNRLDNKKIAVVNMYTQYYHKGNIPAVPSVAMYDLPVVKEAFILCMRKLLTLFYDKPIIIPEIGTGLGGLPKETFYKILNQFDTKHLTVVEYHA